MGTIMLSAGVTIMDPIALTMIQKYGGDFGRERLFSSIGMAIFSPITGMLIDMRSKQVGEYAAMCHLVIVIFCVNSLLLTICLYCWFVYCRLHRLFSCILHVRCIALDISNHCGRHAAWSKVASGQFATRPSQHYQNASHHYFYILPVCVGKFLGLHRIVPIYLLKGIRRPQFLIR
jgi:hypothetical protein